MKPTIPMNHIVWHTAEVSKQDRQSLNGHRSCVIWLTGLSGSGKSTLANAVQNQLHHRGTSTFVLDGDNLRHGLNKGLGFSAEDRMENIRRVSEVAKLFVEAGVITLAALISPFREDRRRARQLFEPGEFIEVYVKCPLEQCEQRDPKGLYTKARSGLIPQFTGLSSPYEEPDLPEITIHSDRYSIEHCADEIVQYLVQNQIVSTS